MVNSGSEVFNNFLPNLKLRKSTAYLQKSKHWLALNRPDCNSMVGDTALADMYHKVSIFLDKEGLYKVLARETEYIESFEDPLRGYFKEKDVDEVRLRLGAYLLTYKPVIMTFRRWSLRRRFDSMDTVMKEILDFVLHGIDFVPEHLDAATSDRER